MGCTVPRAVLKIGNEGFSHGSLVLTSMEMPTVFLGLLGAHDWGRMNGPLV